MPNNQYRISNRVRRLLYALLFLLPLAAPAQTVVYTRHNPVPGKPHDFAFVHITDTHIGEGAPGGDYGSPGWLDEPSAQNEGYSADRLRKAVQWINAHADSLHIRFVIATGDLTDSGERSEFLRFKQIMDGLRIPYIPLIGNHDVWPYSSHDEAANPCGDSLMNLIFADTYAQLSTFASGWENGTRLIRQPNPETGKLSGLQNFSFEYRGYRFLLADFGTRRHAEPGEPGVGPQADLHDFRYGTLPWLRTRLEHYKSGNENIFIFTHWPLTKDPLVNIHLSSMAFGPGEYQTLARVLYPYRGALARWFSGHIHRDRLQAITLAGETEEIAICTETASNKKFRDGHFRIVEVWQ